MKYVIRYKEEILHEDLTEEEWSDKMQDLADQFYQTGSPKPEDLHTETTEN